MSDYSKTINFTAKDSLSSGDPAKVAKGADIDSELSAIETASATKANKITSATVDRVVTQTATGDMKDGGQTLAEFTLAIKKEIHPVGSIYISISATNPATLLGMTGTTWAATAEGRVVLGVGTSDQAFAAAATGGASTHTLTTAEIPAHTHPIDKFNGDDATGGSGSFQGADSPDSSKDTDANTGGDGAHENLPPYEVFYVWERTA